MTRHEMVNACTSALQTLDALEPYVPLAEVDDREFLIKCSSEVRELWHVAALETEQMVTRIQHNHIVRIHDRLNVIAGDLPNHTSGNANEL